MPDLVYYLLIFFIVGVFFLFFHLMLGKLIRPARPDDEKQTIYECGEPTIGSAWIQFDLRYYVVALLFVIFDVEVAFFFPWAVVFGDVNRLADPGLDADTRAQITRELIPVTKDAQGKEIPLLPPVDAKPGQAAAPVAPIDADTAFGWGVVAFFDILVFFGVLIVGFAYLWKRGDINWVRSTAAEVYPAAPPELPVRHGAELVAAGEK